MSGLFTELSRRNVFKVGAAYLVSAWLIAQVADLTADAFAAPDWVMRMLIVVLGLGFPVALFFAWAFELTPEGIKREEDVDRTQSIAPQTGQRLNAGIIVILTLAVVMLLADKFLLSEDAGPAAGEVEKSIAVLPFDDFSPDGDQAWFADGLTEEILNALARTVDLRVASRTASFRFRDSGESLEDIAAQLGVAHILEGSVRRAGDDIRVTAQLIRASDGFHLWSDNFDGSAADAIRIQEEISLAIARALKTAMDPEALASMLAAGTHSVAAYEAFLKGRALRDQSFLNVDDSANETAQQWFDRARELDPGFARAQFEAVRVDGLRLVGVVFFAQDGEVADGELLREELRKRYLSGMAKAIAAAQGTPQQLLYEGVLAFGEYRLRSAVSLLQDYVEQQPNDLEAYDVLVSLATWKRDRELGLNYLDQMVDRLGSEPTSLMRASYQYYKLGAADRGAAIARDLVGAGDVPVNILYQAHRALLWTGAVEEAAALVPRIESAQFSSTGVDLVHLRQLCAEGRRSEAVDLFRQLASRPLQDVGPSLPWLAASLLMSPREASDWLRERLGDQTNLGTATLLSYPQFDPTPFPQVTAMLAREGFERPPAERPPFACDLEAEAAEKSVAVLPFAAMSSGEDDGYFADGLTEEILNSLTALPDLLVTARTSSFAYKGKNVEISEIAGALGVAHVVEGSVRRSGDRVRMTAQLIRASDGFHLWSQSYDRTLDDTFAIQEDIAQSIAQALDVVLDEDLRTIMTRSGTRNVDAFISFQKGQELYQLAHNGAPQIQTLIEANDLLDEAIAAAPRYSEAYLVHSDLYTHLLLDQAAGIPISERAAPHMGTARQRLENDLKQARDSAVSNGNRLGAEIAYVLLSDDWRRVDGLLDEIAGLDGCFRPLWLHLVAPLDAADRVRHAFDLWNACDPGNTQGWVHGSMTALWDGEIPTARRLAEAGLDVLDNPARLYRVLATVLLAEKAFDELAALLEVPRWINKMEIRAQMAAARGDLDTATEIVAEILSSQSADERTELLFAAMLGQRQRANALATGIDARPLGSTVLALVTYQCACGALFDLEAAPNLKRRLGEAGLSWPPPSPVQYPAKTW